MKTAVNITGNLPTTLSAIITGSKEATPVVVHHLIYMLDNAGRTWAISSTGTSIGPLNIAAAGGNVTFRSHIAGISNLTIQNQVGSRDSNATFDIFPISENPSSLTYVNELFAGIKNGIFDLCPVWIYHAWTNYGPPRPVPILPIGYCIGYGGNFGESTVSRKKASIKVNSMLYFANLRLPRRLYQGTCSNALYDAECTISQAAHSNTCTVIAIDTNLPGEIMHISGNTFPPGYVSLGTCKYITGPNAGLVRLIKSDTQGTLTLISPWPVIPAYGDQLYVSAGCDKVLSTCVNKFNNINNFRGFPYIPLETLYY